VKLYEDVSVSVSVSMSMSVSVSVSVSMPVSAPVSMSASVCIRVSFSLPPSLPPSLSISLSLCLLPLHSHSPYNIPQVKDDSRKLADVQRDWSDKEEDLRRRHATELARVREQSDIERDQ